MAVSQMDLIVVSEGAKGWGEGRNSLDDAEQDVNNRRSSLFAGKASEKDSLHVRVIDPSLHQHWSDSVDHDNLDGGWSAGEGWWAQGAAAHGVSVYGGDRLNESVSAVV
jgi:hypothetical protein